MEIHLHQKVDERWMEMAGSFEKVSPGTAPPRVPRSPRIGPCRGSVPPMYPLGSAREFGCPLRARSRTLLSTLVALGLGAPAKTLLFWISVSLVFWGGVLTGVAVLGFSVFESWRASVELPF